MGGFSAADINDALYGFLSILLEGAFFIFIGTVISGFIDAYMPSGLLDRYLPRNRYRAILVGGLLGAVFPVCECAIVPVIRRLLKKGLPLSVAVTYMLSAPIVNPVTIVSTVAAFSERGGQGFFVAFSRVGIAYGITVLVGIIILKVPVGQVLNARVLRSLRHGGGALDHDHGAGNRLVHALRVAQRDFTDVAMYFVVGVALTAMFNAWTNRDIIDPVAANDWLAAPALMVLAFILSLCSTSDAFVAAAMDKFSYAAKLAFLVFGPMMDLKLIFLYSSVFKPRFVLFLGLALFVLVWIACVQWGMISFGP